MKIPLRFMLPVVFGFITCTLLYVGSRQSFMGSIESRLEPPAVQISYGLNAPAVLIRGWGRFLWELVDGQGPNTKQDYGLYLVSVVVLWYIVGRSIDKKRVIFAKSILAKGFTVLAGTALFFCWLFLIFFSWYAWDQLYLLSSTIAATKSVMGLACVITLTVVAIRYEVSQHRSAKQKSLPDA